ncbi:MAG: DUF1223 domain-containing protein [Alphaproteobacteria bacterium]|nr:DUF1223 domain-containing protein [Alphaproteobacteria bacterium]
MRSLFFFCALALLPAPVLATELRNAPTAVIELFTSQGCSSCPPADALLAEMGGRDDVIALAYHVDYWDYIGWRDTFGSPAYSEYQRAYAAARGEARIYTPQLVVNGGEEFVGSRRAEVVSAIAGTDLPVPLALSENNGMLAVSAGGNNAYPSARLWLVTFRSSASVTVERGENRDRVLDYSHIVTSRQIIGMWDRDNGVSVTLPVADLLGSQSDGAAILIQEDLGGRPGRILGGTSFLQ